MPRFVSAAEANRQFSELLGQAVQGETVIITRRGNPVAQLSPLGQNATEARRDHAWHRLLATLEEGLPLGGHPFDRDRLHDR